MNNALCFALLAHASIVVAQSPKILHSVPPTYPQLSRFAQLGGVVELDVSINPDGTVKSATPVENQERWKQLDHCSIEAAKQWVFEKGGSNKAKITFVFHLYPKGTPDNFLQTEFIAPTTMIVRSTVLYVDRTPIIDPKSE